MLLFAGLTNYFNVMIMGRYSRKQELDVMESIGMTKKQKRKMFFLGRKLVFSPGGSACTDCRNRHPVACQTLYGKAGCIFQISISGRMAGRNQSWYAGDTGW